MTLDEVYFFPLGCSCSSSALFLYLSFQGVPYAGDHHRTTNIRRFACNGLDMAKVFAVVALRKVSLSSIYFYVDDNVVKAIQLEYLLRFYVSC
jgi:hypothetical protein